MTRGPLLPSKPDRCRGLRALRYVRVSTEEQGSKYGPAGQHREIDRAVARYGLVEIGDALVDEQSAWSHSAARPALARLLARAAAGELDVLIVAYFSRWSRDTELALRMRRELHAAGVVILFADEDFVSSDEDHHERYINEAAAAEIYSHRLSRTIQKTLAAKFADFGDQAGSAGMGFRRTPQPEARLAIDPAVMPKVVALFERYAAGDVSYRELGRDVGIAEQALREILSNPLYNGWAIRHRGRPDETVAAAPWRADPPVSDELWARVVEARSRRTQNAGRRRAKRSYLLAKRLWCACGRSIAADAQIRRDGSVVRRYRHEDCPLGGQVTWRAEVYEAPIAAQLQGLDVDDELVAKLRALIGRPAPVTHDLRRHQLERELGVKAAEHARRRIPTEAYLAEHARITAELDALESRSPASAPIEDPERIVRWIRRVRRAWPLVSEETRAKLAGRIYSRVVVQGPEIVRVELTEEAKAHGLVLALPSEVVLARPAGARRGQTTRIVIPIADREAWEAAAERALSA